MKNSIGGALCYQQISPRSRAEGDQHRQSHGAHEVCVFNLQVHHGGTDSAQGEDVCRRWNLECDVPNLSCGPVIKYVWLARLLESLLIKSRAP